MSDWFPLEWLLAYLEIAGLAMLLLDGSNRSALRLIRYTYEMGSSLLTQRVEELEV